MYASTGLSAAVKAATDAGANAGSRIGEVVSVQVLRSSGNSAFDRSAVNAVEKAGAFPELQQLPGREFEKTFRRFRLLFRPEDLRY